MILDHTGNERGEGDSLEIEVRLPSGEIRWVLNSELFALADSDAPKPKAKKADKAEDA